MREGTVIANRGGSGGCCSVKDSLEVMHVVHICKRIVFAVDMVIERGLRILVEFKSLQGAHEAVGRVVALHILFFGADGCKGIHHLRHRGYVMVRGGLCIHLSHHCGNASPTN